MSKPNRPYTLVPYNPEWPVMFEKEKNILVGILGETALSVDHIGSTSIEGMIAKPQIDILVVVKRFENIHGVRNKLKEVGYTFRGDYIGKNEQYFTRDTASGDRLVSVHCFEDGNPYIADILMFRDYLRTHPKECDLYAEAKRRAYNNGTNDRNKYSDIKNKVLEEIHARAKNVLMYPLKNSIPVILNDPERAEGE